MKRLFLLRHAEAPGSYDLPDHERGLSDKGHKDSRALGQFLVKGDYTLDHVLCSSATRTKMTLDGVLQSFENHPPVDYSHALYQGSTGDYLAAVQGLDDGHEAALVVGHNPVIHALAAMLAADNGAAYQQLLMRYSPGSLTVLDCPRKSWAALQPAENVLRDFVAPDSYA